ncbi:MAG TPA: hypothetical protein VGN55_11275 [Xanthobacteraceae bacterium]
MAQLLRERVAARAPGWVDGNDSDPGIALLELFAFLTESLLYRADPMPERGRSSAARLADVALLLAKQNADVAPGTLERPRYFFGQLLGVDDFQLEQDYFRERLRRLNRELYGSGVVRGLGVSVPPENSGAGQQVVVAPGFALTASGEEVEVLDPATACLPEHGQSLYVLLLHAERPSHPQPAVNGGDPQFARIEEGFAIQLEPAVVGNGVALARVLRQDSNWSVDKDFAPARVTKLAT